MEDRKKDHIDLAFDARVSRQELLGNVNYEPMFAIHASELDLKKPFSFAGKKMQFPLWVSSMTGGTEWAETINKNLARACGQFGLGMGLGSCRILIENPAHIKDFDVRPYMGKDTPLMMNFGVAQLEEYIADGRFDEVNTLREELDADGLIIHVNPLQEWLQDEGDRFTVPPIDTIKKVLDIVDYPVIVKEVGQGYGPRSMKALLELPLAAIDFGAAGGTNFSKLEIMRSKNELSNDNMIFSMVGHTAGEMMKFLNDIYKEHSKDIKTEAVIVSGGIQDYIQAYNLVSQSPIPAIYGQASALLKRAMNSYEELEKYLLNQLLGYRMAEKILDPV